MLNQKQSRDFVTIKAYILMAIFGVKKSLYINGFVVFC